MHVDRSNSLFSAAAISLAALVSASALPACASTAPAADPPAAAEAAPAAHQPGTLAYDRDLWHELLAEHTKIRRTVRHTEDGVDAVTESDDAAVAAKITEHAQAMQARMKTGARVRVWDPVFAELFKKHGAVTIDVTPTEKGVRIVERSDDPEAVALLRSHAMGVSEFVRVGFEAAPRETPRFKVGDPLPPAELAIGGVKHRILLAQPDGAALAALKAAGVSADVNFRRADEQADFDEAAAAAGAGLDYHSLPYKAPAELTDEFLDAARETLRNLDAKEQAAALHCRTGNRVAPVWVASRVLDHGVPLEQAIAEAKAMQMVTPEYEARAREYVQRRSSAGQ